jgi:cell division transport system permease protein
MAAPFAGQPADSGNPLQDALAALPPALWFALPSLPASAAAIGFITAQSAVRRWLRRLP